MFTLRIGTPSSPQTRRALSIFVQCIEQFLACILQPLQTVSLQRFLHLMQIYQFSLRQKARWLRKGTKARTIKRIRQRQGLPRVDHWVYWIRSPGRVVGFERSWILTFPVVVWCHAGKYHVTGVMLFEQMCNFTQRVLVYASCNPICQRSYQH